MLDEETRENVLCADCRYFVECERSWATVINYETYMHHKFGECRRFPPTHGGLLQVGRMPTDRQREAELKEVVDHRLAVFPLVGPDWCCGEFKQKGGVSVKPARGRSAAKARRK